MNWNEIYEKAGLDIQDTPEHEAIRRLLEKSQVIEGDCKVGGVKDFYIESREDEQAYELVDRLNELCGVYEIEVSFFVAARHI